MKLALPKSEAIPEQGSAPGPCGEDPHPAAGHEVAHQIMSSAAVDELAGGVAHEFNNIFASIRLSAELLQDQLGKDNSRLQTLVRATSRGANLTQKLLAFSRQQRLSPCVLDPGAFVEGMIGPLTRSLGEAIKVELRRVPDLWPVNADPVQLRNVILDLSGNARNAMPLGGRLVIELANLSLWPTRALTRPGPALADCVTLTVSDTGCGMEPDVLERAFEPFFTTRDVGEGSGLGLSMVYGFAKQSGGHVTIESELGRGTTVTLYLLRAAGEANEPAPNSNAVTC
jgi:signal transduction histidine kinase